MQESVSMHKGPSELRHFRMSQARSEEEEKETRKTEATKRKAAQQNKNLSEELNRGLPAQLRLTKLEEERLTSPSHRM